MHPYLKQADSIISMLFTLLQSPEFTRDKCWILFYKSKITLDAYLELKERQSKLIDSDLYDARAQKEISGAFMELLSYPPGVIESKLSGTHPDPFILIEKSWEIEIVPCWSYFAASATVLVIYFALAILFHNMENHITLRLTNLPTKYYENENSKLCGNHLPSAPLAQNFLPLSIMPFRNMPLRYRWLPEDRWNNGTLLYNHYNSNWRLGLLMEINMDAGSS